jgi:tRNA(Arg) A34 adenosine deaminase TadA
VSLATACTIELPGWLSELPAAGHDAFTDDNAAMEYALSLADLNIERATGGPCAAVVFDPTQGQLISVGVNAVTLSGLSVAHAEIVALSLAQRRLGDWNLARRHALTLVSTCEPCAMCFGALPWSGIRRLVYGAHREDAERAGFDEGSKPDDWVTALERRGIEVVAGLMRSRARQALIRYVESGGELYNAERISIDE